MNFSNSGINRLRKISLYLFLVPTVALTISLLLHNILVSFNFSSASDNYKDSLPIVIKCNKENKFCLDPFELNKFEQTTKFDECEKYIFDIDIFVDNKKFNREDYLAKYLSKGAYTEDQLLDLNIKTIYSESKKNLNSTCIRNTDLLKIYNVIPQFFFFVEKFKLNKKYNPGTSKAVFPFIYGETSISNIVKRYPVNIICKPLLYISSLLMILYWLNYNKIFREIKEEPKISKFTIFGIASSLFLFLHVIFLGTTIDNEIFSKIRKLILVLFILCEITAQFLLTRTLYLSIKKIENFIFKAVLNLKIIFVSIIIITSIIILTILAIYNLDSKIDYILEWNYFLFLLIFYLLSSIMWKKQK